MCFRREFTRDWQIPSTENHIEIDPEVVLQQILGLSDALLRDQARCDDQHATLCQAKWHNGDQSTFTCAGRQNDQRILIGVFEMLQRFNVGLDLRAAQLLIAEDVSRRFGEVIHRQSRFLSAARAKVPARWATARRRGGQSWNCSRCSRCGH
ncbi:hypothetical protein D3C77_483270 [compost metagenome]